MDMKDLPTKYAEKYDDETVSSLADLLESIEHVVHILNGVKADILNGNYHGDQARLDYENMVYLDGIDVFTALEEVADAPWNTDKKEVNA